MKKSSAIADVLFSAILGRAGMAKPVAAESVIGMRR
jgi:hypothetical protein